MIFFDTKIFIFLSSFLSLASIIETKFHELLDKLVNFRGLTYPAKDLTELSAKIWINLYLWTRIWIICPIYNESTKKNQFHGLLDKLLKETRILMENWKNLAAKFFFLQEKLFRNRMKYIFQLRFNDLSPPLQIGQTQSISSNVDHPVQRYSTTEMVI